jgi:hypothetical protein
MVEWRIRFSPTGYRLRQVRRHSRLVLLCDGIVTLCGTGLKGGEPVKCPCRPVKWARWLADGTTRGGHRLAGTVRPTLEVVLPEVPAMLRRRKRPELGIALIDPAAARG